MIGRTVNNLKSNNINNPINEYIKKPTSKNSNEIIKHYEKDLGLSQATYSKDLINIMDKENIDKSHLNKNVLNTMKNQGVKTTRENLNKVVRGLGQENIYKLYKKGYNLEKLTIDMIASELTIDPDKADKDKLKVVLESNDTIITNLMSEEDDLTIDNLYKAKYKGEHKDFSQEPTREELVALLSANGVKATRETIKAARSLIGGNLAINKGNIKVFLNYKSAISKLHIDDIIPANAVLTDIEATRARLEEEEVRQVVEDIEKIDIRAIQDTYKKNMSITIENLQNTLKDVREPETIDSSGKEDMVNKEDIQVSKRQLEEIRLKLTLEAALKLNNKVNIKTEDLEKLVQELRVLEKEENQTILKNLEIPVEDKILEDMASIKEKLTIVNTNKDLLGARVSVKELDFTLNHMADYASGLETQPERRFQEDIGKVEDQIEHILDLNEIAINDDSIKAAKALIENNIDISEEAIEDVSQVLIKIDRLVEGLKPVVLARMLGEGIEVDNIKVDEVLNHIRNFERLEDQNSTSRLAEGILELDKSNLLAPEERKALIGVYRMINTISKNETAAIGFLLASGKDLTLGNLFEASKYIRQIGDKDGKLDVKIDDQTGFLQEDLPDNIRKIIKDGTRLNEEKEVFRNWLSNIDSKELRNFEDMDRLLKEINLKKDILPEKDMEKLQEQIKSLENLPKETIDFMKNEKIPLTVKNLYWMNKIEKNPFLLGDLIDDYQDLTKENLVEKIFEDNEDENKSIEELVDTLKEEIDDKTASTLAGSNNERAYNLGKDIDEILNLQKDISENENIYQIPLMVGGEVRNLNLYLIRDKEEDSNSHGSGGTKAYMSLKTENLGLIGVYMEIINDSLSFEFVGERKEITDLLKSDIGDLKDNLEDLGLNLLKSEFSWEKLESTRVGSNLERRFTESKFEHII